MLRRLATALATLALGTGAAIGVAACGEDRGGVEVEGDGAATGKTGATGATGRATGSTGGSTTGSTGAAPATTSK